MSSEMIERVAKAWLAQSLISTDTRLSAADIDKWANDCAETFAPHARAAIEAMREPTRDMVSAANRNNHPRDEETWRTMIDAALNSTPQAENKTQ